MRALDVENPEIGNPSMQDLLDNIDANVPSRMPGGKGDLDGELHDREVGEFQTKRPSWAEAAPINHLTVSPAGRNARESNRGIETFIAAPARNYPDLNRISTFRSAGFFRSSGL